MTGEVYALQTKEFRHGHEQELRKRLAGEMSREGVRATPVDRSRDCDRAHEFPYGTYRMRALHGAPVAEAPPPGEDSVCAPGLLDAYGAPWSAKAAATSAAVVRR